MSYTCCTGDMLSTADNSFSLTAAILLRTIKGTMHTASDPTMRGMEGLISGQAIFVNPTAKQLANYLVNLCNNKSNSYTSPAGDQSSVIEEIHSMIQKYNSNWTDDKVFPMIGAQPSKEFVVLTGGTGALGSYLLALLLETVNVEKVWVLNRKSKDGSMGAKERQRVAFDDKLLDVRLLEHTKLAIWEADLGSEMLGLKKEQYEEASVYIRILTVR
jgi:hypothetical protein